MAASGLAEVAEAAAMEMAMDRKSPRVHLLQLNTIFSGTFDKNTTCSGTDIAKCLERLNGVLPTAAIEPYLKTSLTQKFNGFNFGRETFPTRLGRSASTDRSVESFFHTLFLASVFVFDIVPSSRCLHTPSPCTVGHWNGPILRCALLIRA